MVRVVLDTNVLVNANRGEFSYPKRILDLVCQGKIQAIISKPVLGEAKLILERLVNDPVLRQSAEEYLSQAQKVEPSSLSILLDDPEDVKFLELAVGGQAQFLITNDEHLLAVGEYQKVRIIMPRDFWQWWEAQQDSSGITWNSWAKQMLKK